MKKGKKNLPETEREDEETKKTPKSRGKKAEDRSKDNHEKP